MTEKTAEMQKDYKVRLDVFEGPLDLLLYLIKKDEVDIYDIPIGKITEQYMEYLNVIRIMDLDIAGEFIVMASTLMLIKSRMLLPEDERPDEEEEDDDPRWDLVRQLVEYKKFKDSALYLHELEAMRTGVFVRGGDGVQMPPQTDVLLNDVNLFDLMSAFNDALQRIEKENLREIFAEHFTVAEKVDEIIELLKERRETSLSELFKGMRSRNEVVCTFLATLELIRMSQVRVVQKEVFGAIQITLTDETGN